MDAKIMRKVNGFSGKVSAHKEIKSNIDEDMDNRITSTLLCKQKMKAKMKKRADNQSSRILITINVFGSTGPIRFVVNGDDNAAAVIKTALKLYGRQGRLPVLGSDVNSFFIYPAAFAGYEALKPSEAIGIRGERNFVLCKMESKPHARSHEIDDLKGSGWRVWLQKILSLKILSHQ